MRITYDDMTEFAEVAIRCEKTVAKGKCMWCPFFDRCLCDSLETRSVLCGGLEPQKEEA